MFATQHIAARTRRIGLGIAVAALAVTTLLSPIGAAAQEVEYEIVPLAQQEQTPIKIPVTADLEVVARGKTTKDGTTYYNFLIRNNGPAAASNISAYKEAHTKALIGPGFQLVDNGYLPPLSLASGQSKVVTVKCTPPAGFYCAQGTALVFMNNMADPNFSNDIATIY
jgi:hypothetical protein